MPKNIAELPKQRKESGKAYIERGKKDRPVDEEPSVEVEKEIFEEAYGKRKPIKFERGEIKKKERESFKDKSSIEIPMEGIDPQIRKAEKPVGMARLFGTAIKGATRRIGDYFEQAKMWTEKVFVKKELTKGKPKKNIFESIDKQKGAFDVMAYMEVMKGTSEAVDLDVSDFAERGENGLANLEEKVEEAEIGNEIPESTRKLMEQLEKEAEEAKDEFKEDMSDTEYEARAKEAEELVGKDYYEVPSPKELEEKISKQKKEKFAKSGYEVPSPEGLRKKEKEKEVEMESLSQDRQLRIIKDQLENLREEQAKFKKRAEEARQIRGSYRPETYKQHEALLKEIMQLEKQEKKLEKELKEFEEEFGEAFKPEKAKREKPAEEESELEKEFFEKGGREEREQAESPFGRKTIDESYKKYHDVKEYEKEHGEAPKGESADMYLSFSYDDYQEAIARNPKKAAKMEEEMYEKLAMGKSTTPRGQERRKKLEHKIKASVRGEKW